MTVGNIAGDPSFIPDPNLVISVGWLIVVCFLLMACGLVIGTMVARRLFRTPFVRSEERLTVAINKLVDILQDIEIEFEANDEEPVLDTMRGRWGMNSERPFPWESPLEESRHTGQIVTVIVPLGKNTCGNIDCAACYRQIRVAMPFGHDVEVLEDLWRMLEVLFS